MNLHHLLHVLMLIYAELTRAKAQLPAKYEREHSFLNDLVKQIENYQILPEDVLKEKDDV